MAFVHGWTDTRTWRSWSGMLKRCYNENCGDYPRYGGRGIRVCPRWRHNFIAFLEDMGVCPSTKYSLDRKNVNKGYNKKNCRWATAQEQGDTQSTTVRLTHRKRTKTLREWAEQAGVARATFWRRIHAGWSMERALAKPASIRGEHHGGAKLLDKDVRKILVSKLSTAVLARRYGVTSRHVRKVRAGGRWRHLRAR